MLTLSYNKHTKKQVEINKKLNFYEVSPSHLSSALENIAQSRRGKTSFKIMNILLWWHRQFRGKPYPSMATLAHHAGVSVATVSRAVFDLRKAGLLFTTQYKWNGSFRYWIAQALFNPFALNEISPYMSIAHLAQVKSLIGGFNSFFSENCNVLENSYKEFKKIIKKILIRHEDSRSWLERAFTEFEYQLRKKKLYSPMKYLFALLQRFMENYSGELSAPLLVSAFKKGINAMNPLKAYPAMHSRVSGTPQRLTPPPVAARPPLTADDLKARDMDSGLRQTLLNFLAKCGTVSPKQGETNEEDLRHQHTTYSLEESR